ncbi:MAG: hypothetical protein KZQ99_22465 [Candidatus Thiodiazotropha sp. (ex Dulcina madagascariensis)]|nr:hypothetical protein [Candidatus Thiodiazotropha sp. (ex Dulcina madagascariensis)]
MSNKNVVFSKNPDELLEVDICAVSGWDGFDKLIQFMKNEYSIEVVDSVDGPDARCWKLKADGQEFELRYDDPYGNSIVATSEFGEAIVRKIGLDLEDRLKAL